MDIKITGKQLGTDIIAISLDRKSLLLADWHASKAGRYCDLCNERIPQNDIFTQKNSQDFCQNCIPLL